MALAGGEKQRRRHRQEDYRPSVTGKDHGAATVAEAPAAARSSPFATLMETRDASVPRNTRTCGPAGPPDVLRGPTARSLTAVDLRASGASSAIWRKVSETVPTICPREMLCACSGVASTVIDRLTIGLSF